MTKLRRGSTYLVHALSLLVLLLGTLVPIATTAQESGDVSSDPIVRWSAPFEERADVKVALEASHVTILTNDDDSVVVVNGPISTPGETRLAALKALGGDLETLVTLDAGTSAGQQYWLDLVAVKNSPYGVFTLVRSVDGGVMLTLHMGPASTFANGFAQAQRAVFVDEETLFAGVDPSGLQALLDARLPDFNAADAGDQDAAGTEAAEVAAPTPQATGLIGEGSYVSPHHGVALTWTDEWVFDSAYEAPITSDVNFDVDEVRLMVNSPQWVWFAFFAAPTQGMTLAEQMAWATSPERLVVDIGEGAKVVVSRIGINADGAQTGALIARWTTPEGDDLIVYEEYRLSDDGLSGAGLQLVMLADDVEPGLRATKGLEFEGGPIITLFTPDEVLALAQGEKRI